MAITESDIIDLLNTTFDNIPREKFIDMSQELHQYIVVPFLLTKRGGMKVKKGGVNIVETLMIEHGGRSRWVGIYNEDVTNVIDHLKKMQVQFMHLTDNLSYDRSELLANSGRERINNLLLPRRRAMFQRAAETMEVAFFAEPDAADTLTPFGLKYWIVKNATAGFNGGAASGFTLKGNINPTSVPAFKNYTAPYTAVTKTDVIQALRIAHMETKWKHPKPQSQFEGNTSDNRELMMNQDTIIAFENIGEGQNQNLGRDVAPMTAGSSMGIQMDGAGRLMFKQRPITYVELLNDDSSDPIYGLDMNTMFAIVRAGDNMRLSGFRVAPNQHNVFTSFLDLSVQFINVNPRNNFVVSK